MLSITRLDESSGAVKSLLNVVLHVMEKVRKWICIDTPQAIKLSTVQQVWRILFSRMLLYISKEIYHRITDVFLFPFQTLSIVSIM